MPMNRSELLRPSLTRATPARAPYSQQVHFLASFFGGPFAALALAAINGERLGRWRRDAPWVLLGLLVYLALEVALLQAEAGRALLQQLDGWVGQGAHGLVVRVYALGCFVVFMLRHRREQAACDLVGLPRPAGLGPGIGLILGGFVLSSLLRTVLA